MATHLLQFTLAVIEQYCLFTLTCFKSLDQRLSSGLLLRFAVTSGLGCGRPAGYLPPGTVGQWPPATLQWRTESRTATRKPTRRGRLGPRAGILTAKNKKVLSYQRGLHQHTAKGRDPRTPASWRHWLMRVVAATAGMIRLDGRIRLPFRARRGQLCQILRHRRFCLSAAGLMGESSVNGGMLWGTGRETQRRLNFGAVSIFSESFQVVPIPL